MNSLYKYCVVVLVSTVLIGETTSVFADVVFPFKFSVNPSYIGDSASGDYIIPVRSGLTYLYDVDCDSDGTFEALAQTATYTCHYASGMTSATITIRGTYPSIAFGENDDSSKLRSINQWGSTAWESVFKAFYEVPTLEILATDTPNLSIVTETDRMFQDAVDFNSDIGNWNVNNIISMLSMFGNATAFNQDIGDWNVSNVRDMYYMFSNATAFNQDIGDWNVSNVRDMYYMFSNATAFNQDIGDWNVSNVRRIGFMFSSATAFNQDIGNWDLHNALHMSYMFSTATAFNQDIGDWDVSNVTDMQLMFHRATAFNQDLGDWNVSNVTDMLLMFGDINLSVSHYDNLLNSWEALSVKNDVTFDGGNSQYCSGEDARARLIANHNWTITDGGKNCDYRFTSPIHYFVTSGTSVVAKVVVNGEVGAGRNYSIVGGADGDLFNINNSGELSFKLAPNFNHPTDANKDNIYRVSVRDYDSYLSAEDIQTIRVEVKPITIVPTITYLLFN